LLRHAFKDVRHRHPFAIDAIVVLPDHLHTIWTLPEGDADFAGRWQLIESTFSRGLAAASQSRQAVPEAGARHLATPVLRAHLARRGRLCAPRRLHPFNPGEARVCQAGGDWPHSTFHRMVRSGLYPRDWAGDISLHTSVLGQR
jgi:putative transposase